MDKLLSTMKNPRIETLYSACGFFAGSMLYGLDDIHAVVLAVASTFILRTVFENAFAAEKVAVRQ